MSQTETAAPAGALLITIKELAVLLGRATATLERDDVSGRLPRLVRIGASKKWRRQEVLEWVAAGCPPRDEWEAAQKRTR